MQKVSDILKVILEYIIIYHMDGDQNNPQVEPGATKSKIDYKILVAVVILFLLAIYIVMAFNAKTRGVGESVVSPESEMVDSMVGTNTNGTESEVTGVVSDEPIVAATPSAAEETDMTVEEAIEYYKQEIIDKGGLITEVTKSGEKDVIVAETADFKLYVVYIEDVEGKAVVTIVSN